MHYNNYKVNTGNDALIYVWLRIYKFVACTCAVIWIPCFWSYYFLVIIRGRYYYVRILRWVINKNEWHDWIKQAAED